MSDAPIIYFGLKQCIPLVKVYCYFYWLTVCFLKLLKFFSFYSYIQVLTRLVLIRPNKKLFQSAETLEEPVMSMPDDKVFPVYTVFVGDLQDILAVWQVTGGYAYFCTCCLYGINRFKGLADNQDFHFLTGFPFFGGNIGEKYLIFGRIGA